jgi:hypothetical protein
MTEKVETLHAAGFLISEANGNLSRDNGILVTGQNLLAGAVLGKTVSAGTIAGAAAAGNTGNGTITGLTVGGGAKVGVYKAQCTEPGANVGTFEVEDPDGTIIGKAVVAVGFTGAINFTINDGATDFISGDTFEITVSQLTAKYKVLAPAGTDGSQIAAGILLSDTDASAADKAIAVAARQCEVNANELGYPGGITATQKDLAIAQLAALGILVRP